LLLNHVATEQPKGIAKKEFIPNLAGNYIVVNNETGEIKGTGSTTDGYRGSVIMPEFPIALGADADNGTTYEIDNWFSFTSSTLFSKISIQYPKFHALLRKAGLTDDKLFRYNFLSNNEFYTVLVPGDEVLDSANVNSLPITELKNLLKLHFVQGNIIFTDGIKPPGYYETARIDENSTPYSVKYTKIYIEPNIDIIKIKGKEGTDYVEIPESEGTNMLTGINLGTGQEVFPVMYNNAVIHEISKVLIVEELDTN